MTDIELGIALRTLVCYGLEAGLLEKEDEIFVTNRLLELFKMDTLEDEAIAASIPGGLVKEAAIASSSRVSILNNSSRRLVTKISSSFSRRPASRP